MLTYQPGFLEPLCTMFHVNSLNLEILLSQWHASVALLGDKLIQPSANFQTNLETLIIRNMNNTTIKATFSVLYKPQLEIFCQGILSLLNFTIFPFQVLEGMTRRKFSFHDYQLPESNVCYGCLLNSSSVLQVPTSPILQSYLQSQGHLPLYLYFSTSSHDENYAKTNEMGQ